MSTRGMKFAEAYKLIRVLEYPDSGSTEDGGKSLVAIQIVPLREAIDFGMVLPQQGLECPVTQDDATAVVRVSVVDYGSVLRKQWLKSMAQKTV